MSGDSTYTRVNLESVEDSAARFGFGDRGAARFPAADLGSEQAGFAWHSLQPNKRQPFGHRHDAAEEVCVVIAGSGRVKLDEKLVELRTRDMVRIAPKVARRFEAGEDGMELIVFGARHEGDGEMLNDFWA